MKSKIYLMMCLCMFIGVSVTQATPQVQYLWDSVNYTPASQGWTQGGSAYQMVNDAIDGAVLISSTPSNNPCFTKSGAVTNDPTGWTLTAQLEVLHTDTANWGVVLGVDDGSNFWNFIFYKNIYNSAMDGVLTMPGQIALHHVPDIDTVFHAFQMIMAPGETVPTLYVDGIQIDPIVSPRNGGGTWPGAGVILFGSGNSSATSNVKWQEVSFETGVHIVPEPTSMCLLGLGVFSLLRRKR